MGHSKIKRLAVFLALVFLFPAQAAAVREVVPIGHTAGIRMKSEGVLVVRLDTVQTADGERCPARDAGVREGDIIVSAGGTEVSSNAELQTALKAAQGGAVELSIKRGDETHSVQVTACTDRTGVYRLGILARDSMAGIGTLTFADPQTGVFGSLGHGICDAETAQRGRSDLFDGRDCDTRKIRRSGCASGRLFRRASHRHGNKKHGARHFRYALRPLASERTGRSSCGGAR